MLKPVRDVPRGYTSRYIASLFLIISFLLRFLFLNLWDLNLSYFINLIPLSCITKMS